MLQIYVLSVYNNSLLSYKNTKCNNLFIKQWHMIYQIIDIQNYAL